MIKDYKKLIKAVPIIIILGISYLNPELFNKLSDAKKYSAVENTQFMASSFSIEEDKPEDYYEARNIMDKNIETAWCSAAESKNIIGEYIEIKVDPVYTKGIRFIPGYGASEGLFVQHNIITKAQVTYTLKDGSSLQTTVSAPQNIKFCSVGAKDINLEDSTETCNLLSGLRAQITGSCVEKVKIEILEIKKGTEWDSTCIAEMAFINHLENTRNEDISKSFKNAEKCAASRH